MDAQPLTPAEHYAYTNGACQVFVAAAQRVLGGEPTLLIATDPRQLEQHGWPSTLPLELHIYLTLGDGRVVDAEGVRTQAELSRAFGVRRGYTHEVKVGVPVEALGASHPALVEALVERLTGLGWSASQVPAAANTLEGKRAFRQASEAAQRWWPSWESQRLLPNGEPAPGVTPPFPVVDDGENALHALARQPDKFINLLDQPEADIQALAEQLVEHRHSDGYTPLHLVAARLAQANRSPFTPLTATNLAGILAKTGLMAVLRERDHQGFSAAEAIRQAIPNSGASNPDFGPWRQLLAMADECQLDAATSASTATPRNRGPRL